MFFTSSITQVSQTSRPITPETAATRAAARSTSSNRLISFTGRTTLPSLWVVSSLLVVHSPLVFVVSAAMFITVALPVASSVATSTAARASLCPTPVRSQIQALYRWHLQQQGPSADHTIASQRQRFTPELYQLLMRAQALTPADGRFVDFDLFSGTQVTTFSASLLGCSPLPSGRLQALVAVRAGLRNRSDEPLQQLRYILQNSQPEGWRIADIVYPGEPAFRLIPYLQHLLQEQR